MLVIAHRGYHAELPENTLEAFQAAHDLGVDGIETDLRRTADGRTVLFHDRLTPDGQPIGQVTQAELSRLVDYAVPTLDEALARFSQGLWLLEIKSPDALDAAVEAVRRYRGTHRLMLISFWHTAIEQAARQVEAECGVLICHRPCDPGGLYPDWSPGGKGVGTIVWNFEFLDAAAISQSRADGLKNFVYGVETLAEHQQCRALGLDAVITDHPLSLLRRP